MFGHDRLRAIVSGAGVYLYIENIYQQEYVHNAYVSYFTETWRIYNDNV